MQLNNCQRVLLAGAGIACIWLIVESTIPNPNIQAKPEIERDVDTWSYETRNARCECKHYTWSYETCSDHDNADGVWGPRGENGTFYLEDIQHSLPGPYGSPGVNGAPIIFVKPDTAVKQSIVACRNYTWFL